MTSPDHRSEQLQRLLGCKRYEQPPPGYFLSFSDKVIARIEAGESSECCSWWSCLVHRFDARPALVCAYGLAVSSLLFTGIRFSQAMEPEVIAPQNLSASWSASTPGSAMLNSRNVGQVGFNSRAMPAAFTPSMREELSTDFSSRSGFGLQRTSFGLQIP